MKQRQTITCRYLDNICVSYLTGSYTHCWKDWHCIDYVPEFSKLYLPVDGEGEIVVSGVTYHLQPGKMYLIPAGQKQSYYHINQNYLTKYWCHFTARVGNTSLFDVLDTNVCVDVPDMAYSQALFKKLLAASENQTTPSGVVALKGILLELLAFYLQLANDDVRESETQGTDADFRNVLVYIENNLAKKLTVDELAGVMHLHPNYFIRHFKAFFGVSPIRFINNMRMDRAKFLLSGTDQSISQIARSVGIDDIFYFSKQFKKYNGYAPTEYRHKI